MTYDQTADALYVRIADGAVSRTEQLSAGTLVDLDRFGYLVGIEALHPARAWLQEVLDSSFGEQLDDDDRSILVEMFGAAPDRRFTFAQDFGAVAV